MDIPSNAMTCYSFFLPILLDLDVDELDIGTYLKPKEKYLEKWRGILPVGKKLALRWSGNPAYEQDLYRSLSLDLYLAGVDYQDYKLISVQKDNDLVVDDRVLDVSKWLDDLDDLLACLSLCDGLISSCTSVAHISAAAGLNTLVFVPVAAYYCWLGSGNHWYGNVDVVRQEERGVWNVAGKINNFIG